jgi:hypothetical protein
MSEWLKYFIVGVAAGMSVLVLMFWCYPIVLGNLLFELGGVIICGLRRWPRIRRQVKAECMANPSEIGIILKRASRQ